MYRRTAIATFAALLMAGCGIGEKVMDSCNRSRTGYEWASRKVAGLKSRNVDPSSPTYQLASERADQTREALHECESAYGG
jgi:hypothetical protein